MPIVEAIYQLDAYDVHEQGIDLVDFKSGPMLEGERPKQDYAEQLYFYAYLILENYCSYPRSLSLVNKDGSIAKLEPAPQRSLELANDMRLALTCYNEAVNRGVALETLALPSSESCCFCSRKPTCTAFWVALPRLELPCWNHVALGTQVQQPRKVDLARLPWISRSSGVRYWLSN